MMTLLFIGDWNPEGQCMAGDSLLCGLVTVLGERNVTDFWGLSRHCSDPQFLKGWPVCLSTLAYSASHDTLTATNDPREYDVSLVDIRCLQREPGWWSDKLRWLVPGKTILMNLRDNPDDWPVTPFELNTMANVTAISRPGGTRADWVTHISIPDRYLRYQLAQAPLIDYPPVGVYAAWSDNTPMRREVMWALSQAKLDHSLLRFGSASGYSIPRTVSTIAMPQYLKELQCCRVAVACRGAGIDTLREWEAFALGRPLVTHDFGFRDEFVDRVHCMYYETPEECVERVMELEEDYELAKRIGEHGNRLFLLRHTPEALARRLLEWWRERCNGHLANN